MAAQSKKHAVVRNAEKGKAMKAIVAAMVVTICTVVPRVCLAETRQISVSDLMHSRLKSATATLTRFRGSEAFRLIPKKTNEAGFSKGGPLAIIGGVRFHNGTIEAEVAGSPAKGADESARGFIGICFRVQSESRYEIIYLRPTNSHADDQLRRNHTTQYSSEPDWPWDRLRTESPGVYESWVDIEAGQWIHMRIVVQGTNAALYIGQVENPCLIVHDLKLGDVEGSIGLWMGQDTDGYFRNLRIADK
jgi:hypothetical protein